MKASYGSEPGKRRLPHVPTQRLVMAVSRSKKRQPYVPSHSNQPEKKKAASRAYSKARYSIKPKIIKFSTHAYYFSKKESMCAFRRENKERAGSLLKTVRTVQSMQIKGAEDFGESYHTASTEPYFYDSAYEPVMRLCLANR